MRSRRLAALLAAALFGGVSVLLGPASPASAHAVLESTSPQQGSVVQQAPAEVTLTFSESVRLVPGKTQIIAPDGKRLATGEPRVDGRVLTIPVKASSPPRGTYLVSYRVISADSHPISGGFSFSIGAPSATQPQLSDGVAGDGVVKAAIPVAKYLGYAGLVLVIGPILVLALLWPRRLSRRGPTRLVWVGLGLVGLSTLAGLYLQAPYTTGASMFDVSAGDLRDVLSSQFGIALVVRLGLLAAVAILARPVLDGEGTKTDHVLLAVLGVAGLATWPLSGHPTASPVPAVTTVADIAHLAGMAVWLGGLVMLVGFLVRRASDAELGAILPVWSRWAALAVSWLVLAGVVQGLVEVGTWRGLIDTRYGQLVLVKVALLAVVIAVAAYSRNLVRSRRAVGERPHLLRAVGVELAVTAVVLGLSSVLVQSTPGRTEAATPAPSEISTYDKTLTSSLYSLEVQVDPAKVGNNSVHLYAYTPEGTPQPVAEWSATAALPSANVEPITISLLKITDNHAIGEVQLPSPGQWQLRFTLRTSDIDQATVTTEVPIK
ncbi:MAG: copper resistance protein CopC [Micromonosporaceae bacterium]|nr:copper resistance protein CopC [Micromonosporaceae bacterium]